jgi:F0F1-type ATP synthase assembly protein I
VTAVSRPSNQRYSARELNRGLSNGMEFAGVVLVFFFIGFGLDKWIGTAPWFSIGLTLFGVCGVFLRTYFAYTADMARHEAALRQSRTVGVPAPASQTEDPVA